MAILKQSQSRTMLREAIVLDLGDVTRQAEKIRDNAKAAAERIIVEAKAEATRVAEQVQANAQERGREEGYQAGFQEGREAGHADALAETREQLEGLQKGWMSAATQWDGMQQAMYQEAQHVMLEMSLKLAHKLLHRIIEVDPTVIVDQVANALGHVMRPFDVKVFINPADRPVLEEALPQLLHEFDQLKHVDLVDDESMGRGGCIVRYGKGRVDATIERQLERIVALMVPGAAESESEKGETNQPEEMQG